MGASLNKRGSQAFLVVIFIVGIIVGYFIASELTRRPETIPVSEADLEFLPDTMYYNKLLEMLPRANRSVYVIMFVMKYDPREPGDPVNNILNILVSLKKRGVDVRIIVDDETYESYPETITFLKNNTIPVRLDESRGRTTHSKIVIVDGTYVFIGSHNWTESALTRNHETSILIRSTELASKMTEYFNNIWNNGRVV